MPFPHNRFFRLTALLLVAAGGTVVFLWDTAKRVEHQEEIMIAQVRGRFSRLLENSFQRGEPDAGRSFPTTC